MVAHENIYRRAKYYDIAFDFKDVPKECDFIQSVYRHLTGRYPRSFLELGAGPANFAIEFARRGLRSMALDLSPDMVTYGQSKADAAGVQLEYVCGDMILYRLDEPCDIVALLMDSASYLLDNEAVYRHLESVALSLTSGGIYVLEMAHPRRVFGRSEESSGSWTRGRDGVSVCCEWGHASDSLDPITQITKVTVRLEFTDGEERGVITETAPQRCLTATEFRALVDASGLFKIAAIYGALNESVPFNNEKRAWWMVPVLVRK